VARRRLETFFAVGIVASSLIGALLFVAHAASKANIVYPVNDLGGCKDEVACRKYCDQPPNFSACFKFAKEYNLLEGPVANVKQEDVEQFAKVLGEKGGPGGCNTQSGCEDFCNNARNIRTCIGFAEENNLIPAHALDEVRKVKAALDRGIRLPDGCTNKDTCEKTCREPADKATAKQCFAFAKDAGLLPPEFDEQKTEQMFKLIDNGEINFREMKQCEKLGEDGEVDETILNKCLDLGEKLGFMKAEEKDIAKKMMREGGPGGCRGRACKNFCEKEENQETCIAFAESHPELIPPEDRGRMRESLGQMKNALSQAPPEVVECLKAKIGSETYEAIQSETIKMSQMAKLGPKLGQVMQECFRKTFEGKQGDFQSEQPGGFPEGGPRGEGGFPGSSEAMKKCFVEAGFDPSTAKGPSPPGFEEKIRTCVQEKLGGVKDFEGGPSREFPGHPGEFPGVGPGKGSFPPELLERCKAEDKTPQECFRSFGQPDSEHGALPETSGGPRKRDICPKMPTVDVCPEGQRKVVTFESEKCGTFYACMPEHGGTPLEGGSPGTPTQNQQYQEEYKRQYEQKRLEIEGQYQKQIEQQIRNQQSQRQPPEGSQNNTPPGNYPNSNPRQYPNSGGGSYPQPTPGSYPPPPGAGGDYHSPQEGGAPPPGLNYTPPPPGSYQPGSPGPAQTPPPPQSRRTNSITNFLANFLLSLFGIKK